MIYICEPDTGCTKPKCKISILTNAIVVKSAKPTGREILLHVVLSSVAVILVGFIIIYWGHTIRYISDMKYKFALFTEPRELLIIDLLPISVYINIGLKIVL